MTTEPIREDRHFQYILRGLEKANIGTWWLNCSDAEACSDRDDLDKFTTLLENRLQPYYEKQRRLESIQVAIVGSAIVGSAIVGSAIVGTHRSERRASSSRVRKVQY